MYASLAFLPVIIAILFLLAAGAFALLPAPGPLVARRRVLVGGGLTIALALVSLLGVWFAPLGGAEPGVIALGFSHDSLGGLLLLLVCFVGTVVALYSVNYLDGEPQQRRFFGHLYLTLAGVAVLVSADSLLLLVAGWLTMTLGMRQLLLFYPDRRGAQLAARKKLLADVVADGSLIIAAAILFFGFDMTSISDLTALARQMGGSEAVAPAFAVAASLLALSAVAKTAQLPLSGWITQVMEAPTPVSALLHAGVINAGGFLLVRFSEVLLLVPSVMIALVLVGGVTALFGSLVMLTRPDIKTSLAYSTVAQMGFMILQCGLGAFTAAILHLVAHSLYKAHAFLSSGSVVEISRALGEIRKGMQPARAGVLSLTLLGSLAIFVTVAHGLGLQEDNGPAVLLFGAVMTVGLSQLIFRASAGPTARYVMPRTLLAAVLVSVVYGLLHQAMVLMVAGTVRDTAAGGLLNWIVVVALMLGFVGLATAQALGLSRIFGGGAGAIHLHASQGFYIDQWVSRITGIGSSPIASQSLSMEKAS